MIRQQTSTDNSLVTGNIINGVLNIMIGIIQLILGIISAIDSHAIFILFIVVTTIAILFLVTRIITTKAEKSVPLY